MTPRALENCLHFVWAGTCLVWHKGGAGEEITEPVMGKSLDSEKKFTLKKKKAPEWTPTKLYEYLLLSKSSEDLSLKLCHGKLILDTANN